MHYFLIGPGGAGKSTVGKILADKLQLELVDLDQEFMTRVNHIGEHIDKFGYMDYFRKNSELFFELLSVANTKSIFVLSSGFLTKEEVIDLFDIHIDAISSNGISIRLLPSEDKQKTEEIIVERQLKRGFGLIRGKEVNKIRRRFDAYKDLGDIKIHSHEEPEKIADRIILMIDNYE